VTKNPRRRTSVAPCKRSFSTEIVAWVDRAESARVRDSCLASGAGNIDQVTSPAVDARTDPAHGAIPNKKKKKKQIRVPTRALPF